MSSRSASCRSRVRPSRSAERHDILRGDLFSARKGSLFIGGLGSKALVRRALDVDRVIGKGRLLTKLRERIRDVRQGLDGALYLLTDSTRGPRAQNRAAAMTVGGNSTEGVTSMMMSVRRITCAAIGAAVTAAAVLVHAQAPEVKLPPSPRGSAAVQVAGRWTETEKGKQYTGGQWITVDYGRPILRGREAIFGAGATYGKTVNPDADIWRAGANDTTRLTTQVPLAIGGTTVAPGVYNVLVDLKENAWTFVLSTQAVMPKYDPDDKVQLYGSYNYDPKFDVLRAPMTLSTSPMSLAQFTIGFADVQPDRGSLYMAWDRTIATVDFTVKK